MKREDRRLDYNIVLIALCFLMTLLGLGLWGPKGLFTKPVSEALGIERSLYSLADTVRYAATAVVSVFFERLLRRFGLKRIACTGFALMAAAALFYALAEGLLLLYLGGFLTGVGLCFTGMSVISHVINKTCRRNRGTVMGLVLAANGIGSAAASPIVSHLINAGGDPFGYRRAFLLMAAVFAVMSLVMLLLFRDPHGREGEEAVPSSPRRSRGAAWVGIEYARAVRRPYFYGAAAAILFSGLVLQGVSSIAPPYLSDMGLAAELVALITGMTSLLLAVFKIGGGILYDRAGFRVTITAACVSSILAMVALLGVTASTGGMLLAALYAVLQSAALPMETVFVPIAVNEFFGERDHTKILGIFVSVNQLGLAVGPLAMNLVFDLLGSYRPALLAALPVMVAVTLLYGVIVGAARRMRRDVTWEENAGRRDRSGG